VLYWKGIPFYLQPLSIISFKMYPLTFLYDTWPVLILRVALGVILIAHGWPKLRDLKATAKGFEAMGFKPGSLFGTLAAILEFFGGIALILGFFTTCVAALLGVQFIVILFWKWAKKMPLVGAGGWEFDLLILAALIALFSLGAGAFSLDRIWFGIL